MDNLYHWHTFDFPEYYVRGDDLSPDKLKFVNIPEDLTGMKVLDIGAWDGYFSFVCEKRGAKEVVAFDSEQHSWNPEGIIVQGKKISQKGMAVFHEAKEYLKSNVIARIGELDQLLEFKDGNFDLVLCLGILYHVKDPYKLIRDLYEITGKKLILETFIDPQINTISAPVMRFFPNSEINNDDGTFWGPNMMCVYEMLRKAGFKNITCDYLNGRGVFHAEKN
jgi:tRNA (mo5U34)-methyltransferase